MALEFCPVCGKLLEIKNDNGKIIGTCSCGFKRMAGVELSSVDTRDVNTLNTGEGVVSDKSSSVEVDKYCKKCGHDKAEVSELQSGESTIFIYTCVKCKSVEREVQGSSKF